MSLTRPFRPLIAGLAVTLTLASQPLSAECPLQSPSDIAVSLDQDTAVSAGTILDHEVLFLSPSGTEVFLDLALPPEVDIDAFDEHPDGPTFSLSAPASLDGLLVMPGDVVRLVGGVPQLIFEASALGLGAVDVDGVSDDGGFLLLSFDQTVPVQGGITADDEDVVLWDGLSLFLFFDGDAAGLPRGVDVDAIHWDELEARLWLSWDVAASVGGVFGDDEDVLAWRSAGGTWERAFDLSAFTTTLGPSDVDALWIGLVATNGLFCDGFETGDLTAWAGSR